MADIAPLQNLPTLQNLYLNNTQVADIAPLQNLSALQALGLNNTQVADLRPLLALPALGDNNNEHRILYFTATPATAASPELHALLEFEDNAERIGKTLAFLRTLPPYPKPLPWDSQPPSQQEITTTQLIEAQDATGWRFSPDFGAMVLYIEDSPLEARQKQLAAMAADRVKHLLEKLGERTNKGGLRQEVAEEAQRFADILADEERSLSLRSLELWGSLLALGGQLDANDQGRLEGRDPLDLLTQEARSSLQTFLGIAGNLVRSFPEARELDGGSASFTRRTVTTEMIIAVLETALKTRFIDPQSGALIQHVANVAERPGTQGDKAYSTTAIGGRNLILAAAIAAPLFVVGGIATGALSDIGTDISNEYELGERAIEFIDQAKSSIEELLTNSPPDEAARLRAVLRDLEQQRNSAPH